MNGDMQLILCSDQSLTYTYPIHIKFKEEVLLYVGQIVIRYFFGQVVHCVSVKTHHYILSWIVSLLMLLQFTRKPNLTVGVSGMTIKKPITAIMCVKVMHSQIKSKTGYKRTF